MGEISNKTLALLVLAALVVVVMSASLQINSINSGGITGKPTSDTGNVNLTVASALSIRVNPSNNEIDFGTCTPNASTFTADTNDTTATAACDGDGATPQYLEVDNIGNEHANVTVVAECTLAQFLPTTSSGLSEFNVWTNNATNACLRSRLTSYTALETTPIVACENLTIGGGFNLSAEVVIPTDTTSGQSGPCSDNRNQLTFSASISSN